MSVPCIIHPLQLVIKDSLFEDNHTKLLLAKVRKLVCYISHCSKASELLKKQIDFDHAQKKKQKPYFGFKMWKQGGSQHILC